VKGRRCGLVMRSSPIKMLQYFGRLGAGRRILWCYLIWYLVFAARYFNPRPRLWLTSLGISMIVGVALFIITSTSDSNVGRRNGWTTFRLFLMQFCMSSFPALVKDRVDSFSSFRRGLMRCFSPAVCAINTKIDRIMELSYCPMTEC
jgi:hypothetical protein